MDACHRAFGARLSQLYDDSSAKKMPVISYPTRGNGEFKDYTGEELARMVELAASLYVSALPERALRKNSDDPPKTIGLLGVSNLEYIITFLAAQRLGLTTLFFSIRLSDAGFAHLIEKTECQAVIVQSRYQAAMERAQTATGGSLVVVPMFEGTYLFNPAIMNAMKPLDLHFDPVREKEIPGGIIHSSGSSGLPKPVPTWWHRWLPFLDDRDVHKAFDNALITAPLYHGYGILNLMRTVVFGGRMAFMNANLPITGQQVLTALAASKCTCLLTVPYTLKLVADIPGAIDKMKALDMVQFGGSACPDELGDRLVAAGVTLGNSFGATETGGVMVRSRDQWNWLVPLPHAEPFMEFEHEGGGVYHLVLKPGLESKYFATRPDGSYDTKDLFRPHPTDPKKWKYVSRKDDTIVLVNGEKANPVPLEEAVKQHPDVQMAVGFGTQRDFLGMIVIPELHAASVPKQEMVERIWPRLEGANKIVPAYARISKAAVIVKDAGMPFPLTEKTTLKRAAFIQQFAGDIDAFYARMAGGGVEQHQQPWDRSEAGMRDLVRRTVRETLQLQDASELTDDADFFLLGMDSLQATQVRNVLAKELSVGADELPQNVAFDNPSVTRMAQFLVQMKQGAATSSSQEEVAMGLVKKYSQFPAINRKQTTRRPEKEVVVSAHHSSRPRKRQVKSSRQAGPHRRNRIPRRPHPQHAAAPPQRPARLLPRARRQPQCRPRPHLRRPQERPPPGPPLARPEGEDRRPRRRPQPGALRPAAGRLRRDGGRRHHRRPQRLDRQLQHGPLQLRAALHRRHAPPAQPVPALVLRPAAHLRLRLDHRHRRAQPGGPGPRDPLPPGRRGRHGLRAEQVGDGARVRRGQRADGHRDAPAAHRPDRRRQRARHVEPEGGGAADGAGGADGRRAAAQLAGPRPAVVAAGGRRGPGRGRAGAAGRRGGGVRGAARGRLSRLPSAHHLVGRRLPADAEAGGLAVRDAAGARVGAEAGAERAGPGEESADEAVVLVSGRVWWW